MKKMETKKWFVDFISYLLAYIIGGSISDAMGINSTEIFSLGFWEKTLIFVLFYILIHYIISLIQKR